MIKTIDLEVECCGKEMVYIAPESTLTGGEQMLYICSECGSYHRIEQEQLDEEVLEEYKENYPKEFNIEQEEA